MLKTSYERLIEKADYCTRAAFTRDTSEWAKNWMISVSNKLRIIAGNIPTVKQQEEAILIEAELNR